MSKTPILHLKQQLNSKKLTSGQFNAQQHTPPNFLTSVPWTHWVHLLRELNHVRPLVGMFDEARVEGWALGNSYVSRRNPVELMNTPLIL